MYEPVPRWRYFFTPPHWLRLVLAVGPWAAVRICSDPEHPLQRRRLIHDCGEARAAYASWMKGLTERQRRRYFWGLPQVRWQPSARIIRPLQFHPELARIKREQEEMQEWGRRTGRDPIESPIFQERLRRVRDQLVGRSSEQTGTPHDG